VHLLGLLTFTNFVSTAGYGAVFVLCVLQSCCVPTSSELTMGFAGALAAQGKLNLAAVVVAGVLGVLVGAYIAWVLGRYAGRAVVDRFGRYVLISHHDLDRAEAWYDRHQRFGVFGSRLLPVIRNFVALPAGIAEVPAVRFGVLTAAGSLLWDGAWAGIGYGVGTRWHSIASGFGDAGYVLAALLLAAVAFGVYHRYRSYVQGTLHAEGARGGNGSARHALGGPPPAGARVGSASRTRPAHGPRGGLQDGAGESATTVPGRGSRPDPLPLGDPSSGPSGTVRWIASSSGRPPATRPLAAAATRGATVAGLETVTRSAGTREAGLAGGRASGADRWVASSSRRPPAHARRGDFPNSPIAAWEAAVLHGRKEASAPIEPLYEENDEGVEANGRLTAMLGALLLVLLAIEGLTILRITPLLTIHVVIGMVLVPVILLKIGSTTWRFAKYYLGSPAYRRKGPPAPLLRLLGPFVVVSTLAVVASGLATLLVTATPLRNELLLVHKVTFVLWFAAMVVHVLGHLLDVANLAPRDFYWRTRRQIRGAGIRQWAIVSAVVVGILLAVAVAPKVGPWLAHGRPGTRTVGTHQIATVPSNRSHP
jgi:membrane protein DedA with SNARE-associated domain